MFDQHSQFCNTENNFAGDIYHYWKKILLEIFLEFGMSIYRLDQKHSNLSPF